MFCICSHEEGHNAKKWVVGRLPYQLAVQLRALSIIYKSKRLHTIKIYKSKRLRTIKYIRVMIYKQLEITI